MNGIDSELLPCRKCYETNFTISTSPTLGFIHITCNHCGEFYGTTTARDRQRAVANYNRQTLEHLVDSAKSYDEVMCKQLGLPKPIWLRGEDDNA